MLLYYEVQGQQQFPHLSWKGGIDLHQIEEIKSIFHFDRPLIEIAAHFKGTELEPLFTAHEGTPLIKSFSLYETLMRSIIHQQLNLSFAHTLTMRFVETFGDSVEGVWRYPSPERIASLDVSVLRDMQFSNRKAEYIIGLSRAMVSGELDLQQLKRWEDAEVMEKLVSYRGVGPWTAQNFLMFGLGRPNLFPVADIGLQNALKQLWGLDRKPTKDEILSLLSELVTLLKLRCPLLMAQHRVSYRTRRLFRQPHPKSKTAFPYPNGKAVLGFFRNCYTWQ